MTIYTTTTTTTNNRNIQTNTNLENDEMMRNGRVAEPNDYGPLPRMQNGGDAGAVGGAVVTDDDYALPVKPM